MFAEMRTGSNLLEANLNALAGVTCHGEAYNPHFLGKHNQTELFGIDLAARDADPAALLRRMREQTEGLSGFRYFHDHDPRVCDLVLMDPACAKIILTRNPLESYVSLKIAKATGQWRLMNAKNLKTAQATFEAEEFDAHVAELQAFQLRLLHGLQVTGQTAFYIDYEDLQDLEVLNGLAAFLGVEARLEATDDRLKKQNPEEIADKVTNPAAMDRALARTDWFNLARTPNFEPRRGANIVAAIAAREAPLLYMPVKGGPEARVAGWLSKFGGADRGFDQKSLRQWRRGHPGHRAFTVVRHPLARAHAAFVEAIQRQRPELRQTLHRTHGVDLPKHLPEPGDVAGFRTAFAGFLRFLRSCTSGQSSLRVDAFWASQTAVLQGFANQQTPDAVLREDRLAEGLAYLAAEVGLPAPALPAASGEGPVPLAAIYGPDLEEAARDAYARDYQGLGYGDWRA